MVNSSITCSIIQRRDKDKAEDTDEDREEFPGASLEPAQQFPSPPPTFRHKARFIP